MDVTPIPKQGKKPKRPKGGRARPGEPLAQRCETADLLPRVCTGRPWHRHHILRRSQGGTDDAVNTLDVCPECHVYVHSHPEESYRLGLLQRSTFTPTHETEEA